MTATIAQSVGTLLASLTNLTTIVGSRINQVKRTQESVVPAVTFLEVSGGEVERTMNQGPGGERLRSGIWQIDCWADTVNEARSLARIVFLGLDAYHNDTATLGEIVRVELETAGGADFDDGVKQFFATDDYRIWWRE